MKTIVSKLLAMSLTTLVYINLVIQFVLKFSMTILLFFLSPDKFSEESNCLNFFIIDCSVDLEIAKRFEIVL